MKKMTLAWKNRIVLCIAVLILVLIELLLSGNFVNKHYDAEETFRFSDISQIVRYETDGTSFSVTDSDPGIYFDTEFRRVDSVLISFAAPFEYDTDIQIFYKNRSEWSENNSEKVTISAGDNEIAIQSTHRMHSTLRVDIDNNFQFDSITVTGQKSVLSLPRVLVYLLVCLFVNVMTIICLYKFVKQPGQILDVITNALKEMNERFYSFGEKMQWNICRFYVVMAIILGVTYSFVIPIGQVPDEPAHFNYMMASIGADGAFNQMVNILYETDAMEGVQAGREEMDIDTYVDASTVRFDKSTITFHFVPSIALVRYIPSLIGFGIGYLLNMPIIWCMQLCELFSLLFSIALGYWTLKILPVKKELMCAILLLPVNVQQCASLNYDAVLLPVSFLFTAYIFYLRYREKKVGWLNFLPILGMLLVIFEVKILYLLLGMLIFMIPLEQFELKIGKWNLHTFLIKHKPLWYTFVSVVVLLGCFVVRNNQYILNVRACIASPLVAIKLLARTLRSLAKFYVTSMIGEFGWLDSSLPFWYILCVVLFLILLAQIKDRDGVAIKARERIVSGATFFVIALLTVLCMITWSLFLLGIPQSTVADIVAGLNELRIIEGVQGRYFIPIIFCAFILISGIGKIDKRRVCVAQMVYYLSIAIIPVYTLLDRYWIE